MISLVVATDSGRGKQSRSILASHILESATACPSGVFPYLDRRRDKDTINSRLLSAASERLISNELLDGFANSMMTLPEWCSIAINDQNRKANHLYANYRHSFETDLLEGIDQDTFHKALAFAPTSSEISDAGLGKSDVIVELAIGLQSQIDPSLNRRDFRLAGPVIKSASSIDLISLSVRYLPPTSSSSPYVRTSRTKAPRRITWVTDPVYLLGYLKGFTAPERPTLSLTEMFREAATHLGLKPYVTPNVSDQYDCELKMFRCAASKVVRRPNAWSGGYADKFCGVSRLRSWGSTVCNRTGRSGLPEGVILADDLLQIDSLLTEYSTFRSKLGEIVDLSTLEGSAVQSVVDAKALWDERDMMEYSRYQRVLFKRLRHKKSAICKHHPNVPNCICPRKT